MHLLLSAPLGVPMVHAPVGISRPFLAASGSVGCSNKQADDDLRALLMQYIPIEPVIVDATADVYFDFENLIDSSSVEEIVLDCGRARENLGDDAGSVDNFFVIMLMVMLLLWMLMPVVEWPGMLVVEAIMAFR